MNPVWVDEQTYTALWGSMSLSGLEEGKAFLPVRLAREDDFTAHGLEVPTAGSDLVIGDRLLFIDRRGQE